MSADNATDAVAVARTMILNCEAEGNFSDARRIAALVARIDDLEAKLAAAYTTTETHAEIIGELHEKLAAVARERDYALRAVEVVRASKTADEPLASEEAVQALLEGEG